jgi:hypothetical protein
MDDEILLWDYNEGFLATTAFRRRGTKPSIKSSGFLSSFPFKVLTSDKDLTPRTTLKLDLYLSLSLPYPKVLLNAFHQIPPSLLCSSLCVSRPTHIPRYAVLPWVDGGWRGFALCSILTRTRLTIAANNNMPKKEYPRLIWELPGHPGQTRRPRMHLLLRVVSL